MDDPTISSVDLIQPVTPDWLNDAESERLIASMEYWYPRLKTVNGLNLPKTEWVSLEPDVIEEGTIHEMHWASFEIDELRDAVRAVGGPPAFLRTDQSSDIYNMQAHSRISSLEDDELEQCGNGVINFNVTRAEIPFSSLVVREWLDIAHDFTAWDGKAIGTEIRVFFSDGSLDGWCFDWPKDELRPDEDSWEDKYEQTKQQAESRAEEVLPMAERVAESFADEGSGAWSVDFVLTTDDTWYCTDMAPKRMSQIANELHEI